MQENKKRIAVHALTLLICLLMVFSIKMKVFAGSSVTYISSNKRNVGITFTAQPGYHYDVLLYNRFKKKLARTNCYYYASFSGVTWKNSVYYYRYRLLNDYNVPVTNWTELKPFTTISGNRYSLKIKSKNNRTVKVRVPKVKGVSDYLIYIGSYPSYGFRKSKIAKPGQTVVLSRYAGRKFTWGWRYYVRIVPRVRKRQAQGIIGTGNFLFYKIYIYRYRYRYRYRYVYY